MFPVSCHASDTTTDPVSAPLAGGHAIDDAFCPSSCPTGAGTSNNQCALSHMNAVCTVASISSVMPTVMPAVHDVLHLGQDGCSAVPMPTPPAYESEWRVPVSPANTTSVSAANTTSVHVDMGAVGPGVSAPPAAVASPPARRPRVRVPFVVFVVGVCDSLDRDTPGYNGFVNSWPERWRRTNYVRFLRPL